MVELEISYRKSLEKLRELSVEKTNTEVEIFNFKPRCKRLWEETIINWNGDIIGCNTNYTRPFSEGNNNFSNMLSRMNSQYLYETRSILLNKLPLESMSQMNPCYDCYTFKDKNILAHTKKYIQTYYKDKTILSSKDITFIQLEFTTKCQLKCSGCWRCDPFLYKTIPEGHLLPENLKTLLEDSGLNHLQTINVSFNGEGLMNPHFAELLHICYNHKVKTIAPIGFNFNHITDEQIEAIVDTKLTPIRLSIDGASQETYSQYRIGGNFDRVIENIKRLQAYKQKVGSEYPELTWYMVAFNWNIHEADKARKMAEELGVGFRLVSNCFPKVDTLTPENERKFKDWNNSHDINHTK